MAQVVAINSSKKKGTFKFPLKEAKFIADFGIEGDAHAGKWHRQVSLLAQESVDKMAKMGVKDLTPGKFAENITTTGIELFTLAIGTRLTVGEVTLEVTQIGKKCHEHCQIFKQVGMCIMPTEGIFTKVITGGMVREGDEIVIKSDIRAAIITVSDKGYSGLRADKSGPALVEILKPHAHISDTFILPDEIAMIKKTLIQLSDQGKVDLIFTTGGTGFSPRDVTPEATLAVIDRLAPGIPEAMRRESMKITNRAMLSRAVSGIRKETLIVNLPGSPKAAVECLQVFLPVMKHAVETLRGETFECGRK